MKKGNARSWDKLVGEVPQSMYEIRLSIKWDYVPGICQLNFDHDDNALDVSAGEY